MAVERLAVGGRCAVISYHSGEDRLTKQIFSQASTGGCTCPPAMPCVCGAVVAPRAGVPRCPSPGPEELALNRRAGSARLRAIARTVAP